MDKVSDNVFTCSSVNTLLLNGSCKIMDGKYGGGFYARYRFDQNKGTGFIELLMQYPDGNVVPVLLCKNVCKIADVDGEGVGTSKPVIPDEDVKALIKFEESKGKKLKEVVPEVKDAIIYSTSQEYEHFIKYERPDFPIPIRKIWEQIIMHWSDLPILSWNKEVVIDDVYQALIVVGENNAVADKQFNDLTAVYLTRDDIDEVAKEFNTDFSVLRCCFEARGLWCKDKGSKGYQFTKKVEGKNKRFYKLRKVDEEITVKVKNDFCIDYSEK